ncbi:LPXTG cell wall anchor domain-containing protein [Mycetocola tolaasinivorans]|uniref:LPXTG cell wall anchor domain-containing protein n=1 Tax=Mycetocola tolaasinivorans TaxID=76635 RepID=A0A3L7A4W9_9MICO|nr:LPXTG cell wall anchor domain-containing protein [Mycetocola tolaasinivorans]RLP75349.1 LPXTG cell wall anchor domain-containing protein [Mycetocola tolaasinivorans]
MTRSIRIPAIVATTALALAFPIALGVAGTAATAADTVRCDVWSGGLRNFTVTEAGPRLFRVAMIDSNTLAAAFEDEDGTEFYDPIPEEFRFGTNTVTFGSGVTVVPGSVRLTQSIESGEPSDPAESQFGIERLLHNAPSEGESATVTDAGDLVWVHSLDARPLPDGSLPVPSWPPLIDVDDATSVVEFDLAVPEDRVGSTELITGLQAVFTGGHHGVFPGTWEPGDDHVTNSRACAVTLAEIPPSPSASPSVSVSPSPSSSPTPPVSPSPTPPVSPSPTPPVSSSPTPPVLPSPSVSVSATPEISPDPTASPSATGTAGPTTSASETAEPHPSAEPALPHTGASSAPLALGLGVVALLAGAGLLGARRGRSTR